MTETVASPEILSEAPKALIILVRHEESTANADRAYIQGFAPRVPLSEKGRTRADESGAPGFKQFLDRNDIEVVAACTSEADRAKDTATIWLEGAGVHVPVTEDARLNEQDKGQQDKGGVEGMMRELVETAAYRAREEIEGWEFRPGVDDRPGIPESGAETPAETSARWLEWRDELTSRIEGGEFEPSDPSKVPAIIVFGHNLVTSYGMGQERDLTVPQSKRMYRVDNGEALVLGWDGQAWNLEGQLYRPAEPAPES